MELEKNTQLITNICKVLLRSVDGVVAMPDLRPVYFTPSKITYTASGTNTENGNLYNKNLSLAYPGLKTVDFQNFNTLLKGVYQIYIELASGQIYEVAPARFPMFCRTEYNVQTGHQLLFTSTAPLGITYIDTVAPVPGQQQPPLEQMFNYDFDFNLA